MISPLLVCVSQVFTVRFGARLLHGSTLVIEGLISSVRESLSFHTVSLTEVLVIEGSYVLFSLVVCSDFLV